MNKILLTSIAATLALTGCEQQQSAAEIAQAPDVPPLTTEAEKPLATPPVAPPAPETTVEVAPPPAKPTVGSTVWAIARISVTTDDGIRSIPAGSKLRVVRENETGYVVTDEKQEFPVVANQVSLNSNVASSAAMAEAAARSAQNAWQEKQSAADAGKRQSAAQTQVIVEIQNRHERLAREEAALQASLKRAQMEDSEAYAAANARRYYKRTINSDQVSAWTGRLLTVQAEKTKAFWELKKAQH
jgi:hypothetical protein